jgi:hypothetical protein
MTPHMRACCGLLLAVVMICVITGCGGGGGGGSGENRGVSKHQLAHPYAPPGPGRPCRSATVAVGKSPRALEVTAWCKAVRQAPPAGFILERYSPRKFSDHPVLDPGHVELVVATGPGVGASRARCRPLPKGLACSVAAHGSFKLHTVLAVSPNTRCRASVAVAAFVDACQDKTCVGVPVHKLFFGRPRGCAT